MNNVAGGLGSSLGISASEPAFGTFGAPTRFLEINSETLKFVKHPIQGMGVRFGGVFGRSSRRGITTREVTGDIDLDVPTRGAGLLFAHSLGSYPAAVSGVYTFTAGDQGVVSFTTQVGLSRYDGTVVPKNILGCKVDQMALSLTGAGFLNMKLTIDAADMENTTAMVAPSYAAAYDAFHFAEGTIKINGTVVGNIRDWAVTLNNGLNKSRFNIGGGGKKSAQVHNQFRTLTGSLTAEFSDNVLLNALTGDTVTSIDMTFTNGIQTLEIIVPVAFFDDGTPMIAGASDIDIPFTFQGLDNGTLAPITVIYTTADATL